jgi:hypothetical protein
MDSNTVISLAEISQYLWNTEIPKQNQFFNGTIEPSKAQQLYLARKALQYGVDQNLSGLPGLTNYVFALCGSQVAIAEEILGIGSNGGVVISSDVGSVLTLTTNGTSGVATLIGETLNIPNYTFALSGYVPYTGATSSLNLGANSISATSLIKIGGTSSQFLKADGSVDSSTYLTTSAALSTYLPLSGGTLSGGLSATSLVKIGGTSSQFLKADGSVDSNTYATTSALNSYLPLSGGTLSGGLSGTSAAFSSSVTAAQSTISSSVNNSDWLSTFNNTASNGHNMYFGYGSSNGTRFGLLIDGGSTGNNEYDLAVANKFYVMSNGAVGLGMSNPSYQLQLSTDHAAKPTSSLWTIASDERIKENIIAYTNGLDKLLLINPVTYDYNGKGGFKKGKGGVGVIAQQIQSILPNSVSSIKAKLNETDNQETDILNFNGHELIYVLINSIKELKAQIDELKNK